MNENTSPVHMLAIAAGALKGLSDSPSCTSPSLPYSPFLTSAGLVG